MSLRFPSQAEFSWRVLLTLLMVVALATGMFALLVRRWTTRRQWVALSEWSRASGFRLAALEAVNLPEAVRQIRAMTLEPRLLLVGEKRSFLQLRSDATPASRTPDKPHHWNLLVIDIESAWPATGLRPATSEASLIDAMTMTSYPSISGERFIVFGSDSRAARSLAKSSAGALLPQDIGLILHDRQLLLDFSARAFDAIAFSRMLALADQIVAHLPQPQ